MTNQLRTPHRLLIGGTHLTERIWNDCFKVGFRDFADCFFFQIAEVDICLNDVILYRPGYHAFERIIGMLPNGWQPDYVLLFHSEFHDIPEGIENSPYPTVIFFGDRTSRSLKISQDLRFFDLFVPDFHDTIVMVQSWGGKHGLFVPMWNPTVFDNFTNLGLTRNIDLVFMGTLDRSHLLREYRKRDKIIQLVEKIRDRYRVLLTAESVARYLFGSDRLDNGRRTGPQFIEAMNRARIGLCITPTPVFHPVHFEVIGNGALAFIAEDNKTVRQFFRDRHEVVYYNSSNLLELLQYYLEHEAERAEIARRGYEKVHREFNFYKHVLPAIKPALDAVGLQNVRYRPMAQAPKDQVLMSRGRSYFYNGQFQLAWERFQEVQVQPGPFQAEAANNMAVILLSLLEQTSGDEQKKRLTLALQLLKQALALNPDNTIIKFNYLNARITHQPGTISAELQPDGWLKRGEFILKESEQETLILGAHPYSLLNLELSYTKVEHYQLDDVYRRRVCDLIVWHTWMQVGEQALAQNERESALEAFLTGLPFNPEDYHILSKTGELYMLLDEPTRAIPYLTQAIDIRPFAKDEARWLARCYLLSGQTAEVLSLYDDVINRNPLMGKTEKAWFENMLPRKAIQ